MQNDKKIRDHTKRVFDFINLLRKNGKMKAHEIADELDLKTTRSISIYKKCAEKLGFKIKTTGGYYGGYEIIEEKLEKHELDYIQGILGSNNIELFKKIERINNRV